MMEGGPASAEAAGAAQEIDELEGDEAEGPDEGEPAAAPQAESDIVVSHEPAIAMSPLQPSEPHAPAPPAYAEPAAAAPAAAPEPPPQAAAPPAEPSLPTQPTPPHDEPLPSGPVDHADSGPTDR